MFSVSLGRRGFHSVDSVGTLEALQDASDGAVSSEVGALDFGSKISRAKRWIDAGSYVCWRSQLPGPLIMCTALNVD